MTIRDLIQMDIDIDVYDDVCEELCIAFCGPQKMTEEGKREFEDIMDYEVIINPNSYGGYPAAIICIDDEDDEVWTHRLERVRLFFESAAGYDAGNYEDWFGPID